MSSNSGQLKWVEELKEKFPEFFKDVKVLEIGAAYINGTIRHEFIDCDYHGLDVVKGDPFVDIVSIAHKYKTDETYDVVCSMNALEHDMYWKKTLKKMYELTRPGGLMWFIACSGWEEHGTASHQPENSHTSKMGSEWANYYKNLSVKDVMSVLGKLKFESYLAEINPHTDIDVCFWGVK